MYGFAGKFPGQTKRSIAYAKRFQEFLDDTLVHATANSHLAIYPDSQEYILLNESLTKNLSGLQHINSINCKVSLQAVLYFLPNFFM